MFSAKAAITDGQGHIIIGTVEVDPPGPDEVLVEIKAAGVCHTDYKYLNRGIVRILGHEGAGIVKEVGAGVSHVQAGDRVILNWATNCGECFQCQRGNYSICENRRTPPLDRVRYQGKGIERAFFLGAMAEYAVVARQAVTRIPVEVPMPSAAIVGCAVMTGYGSAVNAARVNPGSSVVVIGAGGVGLNIIQGARIAGAGMIIAIDLHPRKLELARNFGATHVLQAAREDTGLLRAAEEVRSMTGGRGADFAFEATSVAALGMTPLAMIRNGGTAVQASGIEETIPVDMRLFEWDKVYINPRYGMCRPEIDFPAIFKFYQHGQLLLDEMVSRTYALEDLPQAVEDMLHGKNAKGVLVF
jgi:S-(hydroxymethyl)glutathione dehydrogenase / alcohol dehydrogenase